MKPFKSFNKGSHFLRKGRYSLNSHFYFITTSTYQKKSIFTTKDHFDILIKSLWFLENKHRIELHFFIMMPDHIHLVVSLESSETLPKMMQSFKGYTSREILNRKLADKNKSKVWQQQYYVHAIRKEEKYINIMKYCFYNPIRKELVKNPANYSFWWCKYNLIER